MNRNRDLMPGDRISYKGNTYSVGMIGRSQFVALKYPELDRSKSIVIDINSDEWQFD